MIVLSIDQASNRAGISLWETSNDALLGTTTLLSQSPKDSFARRLQHQVPQLTRFLHDKPKVDFVLFEGVKARLVTATVGAFLTCPLLDVKLHERHSFVPSSSWKKFAQSKGAKGPLKDIKGYSALADIKFKGLSQLSPDDEDICDSILIYLTWRERAR